MRAKYLAGICLALILLAPGCKKEPEPVTEEPSPNTPAVQAVAPAKTTLDEAVQEVAPAKTTPDETAQELAPAKTTLDETEYFAVFMEGKKVGHAMQSRVVADANVTTTIEMDITISRLNIPVRMKTSEAHIETTDGKPLGFESVQEFSGMTATMTGTIDDKGMVNLTTASMGAEQKSNFEWPSGALMAEGLRLLHLEKGLKEGSKYSVKIFEPSVMQAVETEIEVGGKKDVDLLGRIVSLTEVTSTMTIPPAGAIVSTSYIDDDLCMQKFITSVAGMTIEMLACAREFAVGKNDVFEIIGKMFLTAPESLNNVDTASAITYSLSPTGETDFNIPSTDNQQVQRAEDGKLTVTVKPVAAPAGAEFPYQGKNETILEATKPNRFLQSDHEEIIKLARSAVGGTKDAGEAVRRIEAFVAEYIENKDLSVGYASALEVAKSKQGDCSEHAVLTAAMCRAVGIPAQMVTGVAYVDDWSGLKGFGGHAWVQAYVGGQTGKWVGLDAAFKGTGRGGYGPGHIALAVGNGEPAEFFNLATTLGKFKIDKAVVKRR